MDLLEDHDDNYDCYQISDSDDSYNSVDEQNLHYIETNLKSDDNIIIQYLKYFFNLISSKEKKEPLLVDDN